MVKKDALRIVFRVLGILSVVVIFIGMVLYIVAKRENELEVKAQEALESRILTGATASPVATVNIDYAKQITTGSPLIFGGSHAPNVEHQDAWDKIADAGVTFIREDIAIDRIVPKDISVQEYKSNMNNVKNIDSWNTRKIKELQEVFQNAKIRGMTVIGIMDYSVSWLSHSNTIYGVPIDWNIYEDIVKKSYRIYRPYLDYLEIWNEPDLPLEKFFLDTQNSNMTKVAAYEKIYFHASKAIRSVDDEMNDGKRVPIGGPVAAISEKTEYLESLLKNPTLRSNVDFVSYHKYEDTPSRSDLSFKNTLLKYGKSQTPIFVTEWSYSSRGNEAAKIIPHNEGITYAGKVFLNYIGMGIKGANYHTLTELAEHKPYGLSKDHAFYIWNNNNASLLPLAKTWRILSKSMALGKGDSQIVDARHKGVANAVGFRNVDGVLGTALVNDSEESALTEFTLKNTDIKKRARISFYIASKDHDGGSPVELLNTRVQENGDIVFRYHAPENAVLGMLVEEEDRWYDIFDPIIQ